MNFRGASAIFHEFQWQSCGNSCQGEQLNFTQIGSDAQVPARTIIDYYQILEDTLIGHLLPAFTRTTKRKAMSKAKFFFFDIGIGNAILRKKTVDRNSADYGKSLEQLIFLELTAYRDYVDAELEIFFWRSTSQFEVDFVIQKNKKIYAIEVKAKANPGLADFKGLLALQEEFPALQMICISGMSSARKTKEGITILPVERFLKELWNDTIFKI